MTAAGLPGGAIVLDLRGARLGYGQQAVLQEVDLEVTRGDFLAVVGPTGSGKTTLLRAVLGITPPLAGKCVCHGRLGYAPQRGVLDPVYPFTAREVVAMGLLGPGSSSRGRDATESVQRALVACGLADQADATFSDLSGGQRQRVLVARALVSEPDVLVLDEPTNGLDLKGEHEVMELVRALHQGGRTVLLVTHLLHVVARYARRIAFIHDGRVASGTAADMLQPARLEGLYGLPVAVGQVGGHLAVAPGATHVEDDDDEEDDGAAVVLGEGGKPQTKEERRAAARARREAARAARSGRHERPADGPPGRVEPPVAVPAPAKRPADEGTPRWLAPALILLLLTALVTSVVRARTEWRAHEATREAAREELARERVARAADARAAQDRQLDVMEEAAFLRTDLRALRLDRDGLASELDAARVELALGQRRTEELTARIAAVDSARLALSGELQRTSAELATARLESHDGAAALDEALRAREDLQREKSGLERALAEADAAAAHAREQARALDRELAQARARVTAVEGDLGAARGELERARPTTLALLPPAQGVAQVTSSVSLVVRLPDGRLVGPAVQAALEGKALVTVALRLAAGSSPARLRLRADVQGEPTSRLTGEAGRFWLDRAAAARCARGFARDGFTLVVSLEPSDVDEVAQVEAVDLIVSPLPADVAARLRSLDPGEEGAR